MITALLVMISAPGTQTAPVAPSYVMALPAESARRAKAFQLAQIIGAEALVIDSGDEQYVKIMTTDLLGDPEIERREKQYPGLVDAMARAYLLVVKQDRRNRIPILWNRMADLYAKTFTSVELDEALAFYSSPAGKKLLTLANTQTKPDAVIADRQKNPSAIVSVDAMRSDMRAAIPGIVNGLNSDDKAALLAFTRTDAFPKISSLGASIQQLTLTWAQDIPPGDKAALEKAVGEAMRAAVVNRIKAGGTTLQ